MSFNIDNTAKLLKSKYLSLMTARFCPYMYQFRQLSRRRLVEVVPRRRIIRTTQG